jgi:hypothetical protein
LRSSTRSVYHGTFQGAIDDDCPLYRARDAEFDRLDSKLLRIQERLKGLAADVGAVAPRYVRIGSLIVAVAPEAGLMDDHENFVIIDLRRPVDIEGPEALAG